MGASTAPSPKAGTISRTTKDVLSGTVGGISQVFVGQPLDILKVRIQTAPQGTYTGMLDCAKQIVTKEGPLAFYKGTLTPLLGVGACVSIQFGTVEAIKRSFRSQNHRAGLADANSLSNSQLYLSGLAAGLANSFVASPVEHVRIRLQTQQTALYSGPLDCIRQIVGQSGISGLFRGLTPTLLREGHGMGVYFLVYEALVQKKLADSGLTRAELPGLNAMLFGAISGPALWLSVYPVDVVKSRMQTDAIVASSRQFKGPIDCARQVYAQAGVKGFFRGLTPSLVRAPFSNAATFLAYEWASRNLEVFV